VISAIVTVLNEGESIRRLLDSLAAQTCRPDEVIIVDGGSRDNTVAVLEEYAQRLPLHIFVEPGANISEGRNRAIERAQGDILAITDAGVALEPDWLEHPSPAGKFIASSGWRLLSGRRADRFRGGDGRNGAAVGR
jgi:glycosyltransferase involved in cell wall biosynthesis